MPLMLLPQPQRVLARTGAFVPPRHATIGIPDRTFAEVAAGAREFLGDAPICVALPRHADTLRIRRDAALAPGAYRLDVGPRGIVVDAAAPLGAWNALQTLRQAWLQRRHGRVPAFVVHDAPDFAARGVYYDVTRGRVPTRASLFRLADELARHKINQLQLYIEHTFAFRGHPDIGRGASPLTADDILALDAHCHARGIELVPSLASFGHLEKVLSLPRYRHLAEDWGVGRYNDPDAAAKKKWVRRGWSLAPANPAVYVFLDSLFAEFLPLFRSTRFNVCCDETWDLGLGQSYALAQRLGPGRLYLRHLLRLRTLAARHGKTMMFWGDIIRHHPDLIPRLPKDAVVLDWGYAHNHPFDRVRDFAAAGLPFYACPGTSAWVSLFPRLPTSEANIAGFAAAARRHGAAGLLNTDWGDGGHYNFMELSWYGYLFGAEQAWNTRADARTFPERFCRLFLRAADPALPRALRGLARVAQVRETGHYQQYWRHVFFSLPEQWDGLVGRRPAEILRGGRIVTAPVRFNAAFGRVTLRDLDAARRVFARHAGRAGEDPQGVLPYWLFAIDTLRHAARKLALLGPGGPARPPDGRALAGELRALRGRFEALWMARNRRSEIAQTLAAYDAALRALPHWSAARRL